MLFYNIFLTIHNVYTFGQTIKRAIIIYSLTVKVVYFAVCCNASLSLYSLNVSEFTFYHTVYFEYQTICALSVCGCEPCTEALDSIKCNICMIPFSTTKQIRILYNSIVLFCICTHKVHLSGISTFEWSYFNEVIFRVRIESNLSNCYVFTLIKCYRVICLTLHSSYLEFLSVKFFITKTQIRRFDDVRHALIQNNIVTALVAQIYRLESDYVIII